jgi:hypothetical protein
LVDKTYFCCKYVENLYLSITGKHNHQGLHYIELYIKTYVLRVFDRKKMLKNIFLAEKKLKIIVDVGIHSILKLPADR